VDGGCEFYDVDCGDSGAAGGFADDVREAKG